MSTLEELMNQYSLFQHESFSLVSSQTQELRIYSNKNRSPVLYRTFTVSTAKNGLGEEMMSFKTPRGLHQIKEKIGEGLEVCSILKARKFTGEVWSESCEITDEIDLILTRALWLDGLEEHNQNSFDRFIYIHGTNAIEKLGQAQSEGCVRMSNQDIIEYYDYVSVGHLVVIL